MITRTLHGLPFRVISPSFYELALVAPKPLGEGGSIGIEISFLGDLWYLTVPGEHGEPLMQPFNSLDEAAGFVALGVL